MEAKIPEYLKPYSVVHKHDDGDLTIEHRGTKYVVTTDGQVFKEYSTEQCLVDELERPSEEWLKMSREEKREAARKAMNTCISFKLREE